MFGDTMKRRFGNWLTCVVLGTWRTAQESGNCTLALQLLVLWTGWINLDPFFCGTSFLKLDLSSSTDLLGREESQSGGLVGKKWSLSLSGDRNYLTNQV